MASITIPGRIVRKPYTMIRAVSIEMADGTHAGFDLDFREYGGEKIITVHLDHYEADQLVNWQNYIKQEATR